MKLTTQALVRMTLLIGSGALLHAGLTGMVGVWAYVVSLPIGLMAMMLCYVNGEIHQRERDQMREWVLTRHDLETNEKRPTKKGK
jgi:hypothetical protein